MSDIRIEDIPDDKGLDKKEMGDVKGGAAVDFLKTNTVAPTGAPNELIGLNPGTVNFYKENLPRKAGAPGELFC